MNKQPITKQNLDPAEELNVVHIFETIQGEGPFSGRRAVFIRLAGCNLQCPKCDTDYTKFAKKMTLDQICTCVDVAGDIGMGSTEIGLVVITGGEPLLQPIGPLVSGLLASGMHVQLETNGTVYQELPYASSNMTVVCSPKASKIHPDLVDHIDYYKYPVSYVTGAEKRNGLPWSTLDRPSVKGIAVPTPDFPKHKIFLTPESKKAPDGTFTNIDAETIPHISALVMKHGYTAQIQLHKLLGVE